MRKLQLNLPAKDCDLVIGFPDGGTIRLESRPSEAEVLSDGTPYRGTLSLVLEQDTCVTNWRSDMSAAPAANPHAPWERVASLLVMEIPQGVPDGEAV